MAHRTHDLAVVVGSYEDRDGNEKKRYANIGVMMQGDNGPFILLDRHFNPAGINGKDGKIVVSCFEPKERDQSGQRGGGAPQTKGRPSFDDDLNDDPPFATCDPALEARVR